MKTGSSWSSTVMEESILMLVTGLLFTEHKLYIVHASKFFELHDSAMKKTSSLQLKKQKHRESKQLAWSKTADSGKHGIQPG